MAAIGKVHGLWRIRSDDTGLATVGLVALHPRLTAMQPAMHQAGHVLTVYDVGQGCDDFFGVSLAEG